MKILVVHPAQQHSYRLAAALEEKGWLYRYVTTVYNKKGSITGAITHVLPKQLKIKASNRRCEALPEEKVILFCEGAGLLKLLIMHFRKLRPIYTWVKYSLSDRFAKRVAHYAIKYKVDAVVCYDDYSSRLFSILEQKAPDILRIMDVSAANILYMRKIYEHDMQLQPSFAHRLQNERRNVWSEDNIQRTHTELYKSQLFLVPSQFVKRSLLYSEIDPTTIKVCPYGVDIKMFSQKAFPTAEELGNRPLRFIYVGGVKELKGISYLLQAFAQISSQKAQLTVVGQADLTASELAPYLDSVTFTGAVLHQDVPALLQKSDVFVFPSLGEGLSLATLEAAACGLPLIVSENSGVNDLIEDGKNGFVIPIQSSEAIAEKVLWFIDHIHEIEPMGRAARKMALHYSWDRYSRNIQAIFEEIAREKWEN